MNTTKQKTVRCPLTLTQELSDQFRVIADKKGMSVTTWLRDLVQTFDGMQPEDENRIKAAIQDDIQQRNEKRTNNRVRA